MSRPLLRAAARAASAPAAAPLRPTSAAHQQARSISVFSTTGIPGAFLGRYPQREGVDVTNSNEFVNGVPYLEEGTSIQSAALFLERLDVGAVPVLGPASEQGGQRKVTGMFSERDVARAFGRLGAGLLEKNVSDFMSRDVVACSKGDSLQTIIDMMLVKNFRHLPCLDKDGSLIGLVSMRDAMWLRAKERLEDPMSSIQGVDDFLAHITDATRF